MKFPNYGFGVVSKPSGQFGNHLFQKYFLQRFGEAVGSSAFHRKFIGHDILSGLARQGFPNPTKFNHLEYYPLSSLENEPLSETILRVRSNFEARKVTVLPSGVMDPYFFELPYVAPDEIFKWKTKFPEIWSKEICPEKRIALHFRGGDFENWDSRAVLPATYYTKALDELKVDETYEVVLFTDDPNHKTPLSLIAEIPNLRISNLGRNSDFYSMSNSGILIGSPSSYCFWASTLTTKKFVVMPKDWLDYKCGEQDQFWIGLRTEKYAGFKINLEV